MTEPATDPGLAAHMRRRNFLNLGLAPLAVEWARPPNLCLIMTDQQRPDFLGCYGQNPVIRTPHLDHLAAGGVRFTQTFIAGYPCCPSRASLLTGLYPHAHGVIRNGIALDAAVPTLGDVLKNAGYRTAWMGKWHLGSEDEPQHGFDRWVGGRKHYRDYLAVHKLLEPIPGEKVGGLHHTVSRDGHSVIPEEHFMESFLAGEAVRFLREQRTSKQPFFLGFSCFGPHQPTTPPEPWDKKYTSAQVVLSKSYHDELHNKPARQKEASGRLAGRLTEAQFRRVAARYYGYVEYLDRQIGRVLDALEECGLAQDTVVAFTSDHGEMLGAHGFIYKGPYLYDEVVRVPLLLRYPRRIAAGRSSAALISNVDVAPTLLELLGLPTMPRQDGRSLLPLLRGASARHRDMVFCEHAGETSIKMARTRDWKLALNWRPPETDELYDLARDPLELNNLIDAPAAQPIRARLAAEIRAWLRDAADGERL